MEIAAAIADGLGAAHGQGIAHRDLKPDNIYLTADNRVKILDFGLATSGVVCSGNTETGSAPTGLTAAGTVLGTVGYMAPEQVNGAAVDARADIFALGCVLFEMVSGRRAFAGATPTETLAAILSAPAPALAASASDAPPELERLVARCLEKQPGARFQSATDLAFALRALLTAPMRMIAGLATDSAGSQPVAITANLPRRRAWRAWGAAALGLVGIVAAAYVWTHRTGQRGMSPVPVLANPAVLTASAAVNTSPTWSPDGRAVAYESDASGGRHIWVSQVGNPEAINRTADSKASDTRPRWSPDGQWIAFMSTRDNGGYFVMAAVGGTPRKVAAWPAEMTFPSAAAWSPDSKELAFPLGQRTGPWIEIVTLATGASRKVALPSRPRNNVLQDIAWSPDGRWLAYARGLSTVSQTYEIWLTRVSDEESIQLTDGKTSDTSPAWSPDSASLYFKSNRIGTADLWRQALDATGRASGPAQQVTVGIGLSSPSVSLDGRRIAYAKGSTIGTIYRVPMLSDRPATWADAQQLFTEAASMEFLDVWRDGKLAFSSSRGGDLDLWARPADGGPLQRITSSPSRNMGPRWSPDGLSIAYYSQQGGKRDVWVTPVSGGAARQITKGDADNYYPSWSPDGREIVFQRSGVGLYVVPAGGGPERQLTPEPEDFFPDWSPDGWIVFVSRRRTAVPRLWRIPAAGGTAERLTDGYAWYPRCVPGGRGILFERDGAIWILPVGGGRERPLTALAGRRGEIPTWAVMADGRWLYFSWSETRSDIWVADLGQPAVK